MIGNVELKRMLQCLIAFIILYKKRKVTVKKIKPFSKCQRAGISKFPRQDDFRNFCISDDTEEVYQELVEAINICKELKNNKKGRNFN
jgi:hypothetical protein